MIDAHQLEQNRKIKNTHRDFYIYGDRIRSWLDWILFLTAVFLLLNLVFDVDWLPTVTALFLYLLVLSWIGASVGLTIWLKRKKSCRLLVCPECQSNLLRTGFLNDDEKAIPHFFKRVSLKNQCWGCKLVIWKPPHD